jgi:glycosyltransferase involved in cell wall biosynthesis
MRIFVHDYAGHPFQFELSRALARRGHIVRHAYFAGDKGPKGSLERKADDPDSFSVAPVAIAGVYSKGNFLKRHWLDGVYGRAAARMLTAFGPDVTLVSNTPPNALRALQKAARASNARFVIWLQDVFGMAVAALLKDKWVGVGAMAARYYQTLERTILRRADGVVAISEDFRPYLDALGVEPGRVAAIANWGPMSEIAPRPKANPWSIQAGVQDKLVFAYTGTLGMKHNPDRLYQLAAAFAGREDVQVRVSATGVGAEWLARKAAAEPTPRLVLTGLAPIEELADLYGGSDVLVALLEEAAGRFSAPSKVLTYLCAGRPILLSAPADNIATRTVAEAKAGPSVDPSDATGFLAAAHGLAESRHQREILGANGRAYAETAFDIEAITDRFEAVLRG